MVIKKIFLFSFLILSLAPNFIQAQGLVPCGYDKNGDGVVDPRTEACQFCDFFVLINGIVRFVMFRLVPIAAVLMLIISGIMFFLAGAKPDFLNKAKGTITGAVIGLVLIYAAWIIVNTILNQFGIVESGSVLNWYKPSCPAQ